MTRATNTITLTATPRWWLKHYLFGVLFMACLTGREPNWERVRYWVGKGIKIEVH